MEIAKLTNAGGGWSSNEEVNGWVEVILAKVDGREWGMPAVTKAKQIAAATGWTLVPRAPQCGGQRRDFDRYEGKEISLIMTLMRLGGEPPARECRDSTYMVNGKRVVRDLEVYRLHRDGHTRSCYMDKNGYRVTSRALEHGPLYAWARADRAPAESSSPRIYGKISSPGLVRSAPHSGRHPLVGTIAGTAGTEGTRDAAKIEDNRCAISARGYTSIWNAQGELRQEKR